MGSNPDRQRRLSDSEMLVMALLCVADQDSCHRSEIEEEFSRRYEDYTLLGDNQQDVYDFHVKR